MIRKSLNIGNDLFVSFLMKYMVCSKMSYLYGVIRNENNERFGNTLLSSSGFVIFDQVVNT